MQQCHFQSKFFPELLFGDRANSSIVKCLKKLGKSSPGNMAGLTSGVSIVGTLSLSTPLPCHPAQTSLGCWLPVHLASFCFQHTEAAGSAEPREEKIQGKILGILYRPDTLHLKLSHTSSKYRQHVRWSCHNFVIDPRYCLLHGAIFHIHLSLPVCLGIKAFRVRVAICKCVCLILF